MRSLDFDAQTAFGGVKYVFGKWSAAFDFSYTRLVDQPSYTETYHEFLPALTLQRFFPVSDTILISAGNQVDYHFTYEPTTFPTTSGRADLLN